MLSRVIITDVALATLYVILYADDILLSAKSGTALHRMLWLRKQDSTQCDY